MGEIEGKEGKRDRGGVKREEEREGREGRREIKRQFANRVHIWFGF